MSNDSTTTTPTTEATPSTTEATPTAPVLEAPEGSRPGRPSTAGLFPRRRPSRTAPVLSDADAERLRARVPDNPVRLPDAYALACTDCGVVVPGPHDDARVLWVEAVTAELRGGVQSHTSPLPPVALTTCAECEERHHLADTLAAKHFPSGFAIGGLLHQPGAVGPLVSSTLAVLDVLGVPAPTGPGLTADALALAVRHLAPLGGGLAWRGRFAPVRAYGAQPDTANPHPWAHVREGDRARLRSAYAAVMADRLAATAPPVPLAPPKLTATDLGAPTRALLPVRGGCIVCGVGAVEAPAVRVARAGGTERAARDVWELVTCPPDALGGMRSPEPVVGHICPACAAAHDYTGAVGPSLLERSLTVHLEASGVWRDGVDQLPRLKGWGALYADAVRRSQTPPAPNRTPRAHLGDLDALARRIRNDLGVNA